ncbi:MAG TPA: TIGR04372 family glycosyltransferase [Chlamydiales bacterium]|nr:TIGR04372 family glycosyltransferase [Chlamydiales bacterium]
MNVCFLANIPDSDGVGHIVVEIDDFMRRLFLKEIDATKKYVLIRKSRRISREFTRLYKHKFDLAVCSSFLYYLTLPLIIRYADIRLDCGLSRTKWHKLNSADEVKSEKLSEWPKTITKHKNLSEWEDRYRRRVESPYFTPLRDFRKSDDRLDQFLAGSDKIALIHLKTNISNATAKQTDSSTYIPTIEALITQKYQLVFAGREKMPELFKNYDIFNYAESKLSSFTNDIILFNRADLAIMGGSGIFLLAECLNIPLLYINYWHLYRLPATSSSICVPALVQDLSGRLLTFSDQWNLYKNADDAKSEVFPFDRYEARNATADEILKACQELIEIKRNNTELTALQKKFNNASDYYFGESRISDYFIQQHKDLL